MSGKGGVYVHFFYTQKKFNLYPNVCANPLVEEGAIFISDYM